MTDSLCSTMSEMSVMLADGSEQDLEKYIVEVFLQLQGFHNGLERHLRDIASNVEQDDDVVYRWEQIIEVFQSIDDLQGLFTELRDICKQIAGKPDKEDKEEVKALLDKYRADAKEKKAREREEKKAQKAAAKAERDAAKAAA